jgi:PAS domain S-box-containing protein
MPEGLSSLQINEISNLLFASAAEGLVVANDKGLIQLVNPRIEELFGYSSQELIGKPVELLMPEAFRKRHVEHRHQYNAQPTKRAMGIGLDLIAERKDGSVFPIEISLNHFQHHGQMMVMALVSDVTERKKADMALKQLNQELEQMVAERTKDLRESQKLHSIISRNFPNGTINVFDRNLNYIFIEGMEMYRMGIDSSHLVGTSYLERLDPQIRTEIKEKLMQVFEGENSNFEIVFKGRTYMINAVALPDDDGTIDQILVVEQNITALKKAQSDIKEALEKERQLSELKSRFVSMASHEFRTPLTTVLSSLALLKKYIERDGDKEKQYKHIARMRSSVHHLTSILNDFLSIDKLEEGKIEVNLQEVSIPPFITEIAEDVEGMAKEGQNIECEISGINQFVTDKNIIRNIMHNLLSNAIKYSPENSTIKLAVSVTDKELTLCVADEGMGIPEAEQKHLFERFFRAKNALNIEGTGLGLSIIKKYVDLLQGTIVLKSAEGIGTECTIVLLKPNAIS